MKSSIILPILIAIIGITITTYLETYNLTAVEIITASLLFLTLLISLYYKKFNSPIKPLLKLKQKKISLNKKMQSINKITITPKISKEVKSSEISSESPIQYREIELQAEEVTCPRCGTICRIGDNFCRGCNYYIGG